jgi:hypothetical protein
MAPQEPIRLDLGGQHLAGDPADMPEGATRLMENMTLLSGVWQKRPAFFADTATGDISGLAVWDDGVNGASRLIARSANGLYLKAVAGEAYTGPTSDGGTGYMADYCTYRDKFYYTLSTDLHGENPSATALIAFDGTAVTTYPLGDERIYALTVTPFIDRLFIANAGAAVTNYLGTSLAYDPTAWTLSGCTASNVTSGSSTVGRVTPTSTTAGVMYKKSFATVLASAKGAKLTFRADLRNTSSTYQMPLTLELYVSQSWQAAIAYVAGVIAVPTAAAGNGFRYRVTVAGTSAGAEPAWPTTVGTTVVDNGVTWVCEGTDAIGSQPLTLPTITESPEFTTWYVTGKVPILRTDTEIGARIKFFTTATPTITLAAIDVSLKDGLTDGDARKANRGLQVTTGAFKLDFINKESTATATVRLDDDIYWTETSDPNSIDANNSFKLRDVPGRVTAAAVVGSRIVFFKRRGMWVFQGTDDPNNPLIRENVFKNVGCIGPRAVAVFEDRLYFIGQDEIYMWEPGTAPVPLCRNAMRDEVMSRGDNWIQVGAGGVVGVPTLGIDQLNRDLYVVTQYRKTYVLDLDTGVWSQNVLAGSKHASMYTWNPNRNKLYAIVNLTVSNTGNVQRIERTDTVTDANGAVESYITLRPLQRAVGSRYVSLDAVGIHHMTTADQTGMTFKVEVSTDGGATFTKYNEVTLPTVAAGVATRTPVPLRQSGNGDKIVVRLYHSSTTGGSSLFRVTAVDAIVRDLGPYRVLSNPTQVAASL